jgi:LPXTG-motif cell wall-anchored protein
MVHRWLARTLIAAGLVAVGLHGASTAWAVGTSEVSITDGTLPVSATAFPTRVCPGAPRTDEDIWTFGALAGDPGTSAGFVQVTLTFDPGVGKVAEPSSTPAPTPTPGAVQIRTIGAESFLDPGVASVTTPAGWTLVAAVAQLTVEKGFFTLTGTCPAGGAPVVVESIQPQSVPSTVVSTKAPVTPAARRTTRRPLAAAAAGSSTTTPGIPPASSPAIVAAPRSVSSLPTTGTDIGGMLTLGVTMVGAGVLLLIVRRRQPTPRPAPTVDDALVVWFRNDGEL